MARLRSSRRRRRERPPHRTARTVETVNKADSTEPGRPKPAQRRAQQQTRPRLPFGGWAWGPPGSESARQRIRRARREKTYSVSRAWASTGVLDVTRALIGRQRADATRPTDICSRPVSKQGTVGLLAERGDADANGLS